MKKNNIKNIALLLIAAIMLAGTASAVSTTYTEQDTTPDIYVYGNSNSKTTGFESLFATTVSGSTWTDADGRLAVINEGDYMLINTENPTSEFCIVFASDKNDGYARVYVDGNKVWSDNTYSDVGLGQSIDKQTIRTLHISDLDYETHSIKIKNTNANDYDVTIYKYGYNCPETEEIPEFPTIAAPVAAIIGLAFIFTKRKEE
ncbi:PEF-CTERM sorting domain-containing protein [uncultured Methanolobus sp.]|uniref:PEF-CTERM sorting domain-containing protein n=1 Tax=uncultured Methanolobus sp. TaxID=218300 RepID=UPI002AAB9B27|nr:PEF-CTERM sorting domain-containing protein [uncultured Methanolobus sp.]